MARFPLTLFLGLAAFTLSFAQPVPNRSPLTVEQIMQGERFVGFLPEDISWHPNSQEVHFSWNPGMDTLRSGYRTTAQGAEPKPLSLQEQMALPRLGAYNEDYSRMVYSKNGDLFLYEVGAGLARQLTNTLGGEYSPAFAPGGQAVVYQSGDNLFQLSLQDGQLEQLTNFREGAERKEGTPGGQDSWLEAQQDELFEVLRWRAAQDRLRKAEREALEPKRPAPFYLKGQRLSNLQHTPDARYVTFRLTQSAEAKRTQVPAFVDGSGYLDISKARPKVGHPQDTHEMGIYDRGRDTFYMVSTEALSGIRQKPAYKLEVYGDTARAYDNPRAVIIHGPVFSEEGQAVVTVRAQDNKSRWIARLDLATGALEEIDHQRDEAWVGGPGISGWNFSTGTLGWLNEEEVYFQSEATGYSHLYVHNLSTGERRALTSGPFEVREASLSRDKETFFLTANAEGPHEQHFYHLSVKTGELQRITTAPGKHEVSLSPDEKHLAIRYSYSNKPWELFVMPNRAGATPKQVTSSTTPDFDAYPWREPKVITFSAADGAKVPARLYQPKGGSKGGPAVIFVHGAGYLQNVHRWWSSYYREYMFHNLLADNGYTVLDIDYRGSDGYGRDWRTGIYRYMGGKDLSDQVDGARYLAEELGCDPSRMGIYGGSYGGFITLMALFNSPETFACGAALRSVTDWAHYNHPYTSNILNTPQEDSIAFRRSSPIYHAEGLQGHLLILHGMVDDNVQFQDVVRLSQRLIELGKDNWEMALFPMEPHGFVEPSSWADEYKRIFKLFQTQLRK